ncbi:hypothetical protein [Reichenbachiella ulvae]|uniref:Uncharacterized protein n=1 Tax=Reichenbachiella ulvae TaxID=2980104 RepID=A0ABT3CPK0_9BACT|nr:hypothetical protein [Reichenbachiella ulvae]MCV9385389.1 hypothetical protein [Reichenbachiella ulvae]
MKRTLLVLLVGVLWMVSATDIVAQDKKKDSEWAEVKKDISKATKKVSKETKKTYKKVEKEVKPAWRKTKKEVKKGAKKAEKEVKALMGRLREKNHQRKNKSIWV